MSGKSSQSIVYTLSMVVQDEAKESGNDQSKAEHKSLVVVLPKPRHRGMYLEPTAPRPWRRPAHAALRLNQLVLLTYFCVCEMLMSV